MVDWTSSMQQTYEYYIVDPGTWQDVQKIDTVISCTIDRDLNAATLGSATFDLAESIDECYIRVYLVTIQNGVTERHPLGTCLVQTPYTGFDGKTKEISVDAYTPLLEIKEKHPPIGYYVKKDANILTEAYKITRECTRSPVVEPMCEKTRYDNFVADTSDTWLDFLTDLLAEAEYRFELDEMGRILFTPVQDTASLQPIWTYDDDNSSILCPELSLDHDLYGIPNVVEVVFSPSDITREPLYARIVNDDPNSPISTVRRGREIVYRDLEPNIGENPTQELIDQYAKQLLRELSTMEYTIAYTHGYCPVRVGDCIMLNYSRAGLTNVKAKVVSQSIDCKPGCLVTEEAVFTAKMWGD